MPFRMEKYINKSLIWGKNVNCTMCEKSSGKRQNASAGLNHPDNSQGAFKIPEYRLSFGRLLCVVPVIPQLP